ncbi:MAG: SLBB domain-containing protein [Ignavibacteriae bacterium]|nr:SLBB domain-containing protein [Ignavibacteriota bacterium]
MKLFYKVILIFVVFQTTNFSQVRDYELGTQWAENARRSIYGGFYDYSDPEAVNINVSVWGFVRYPGRYIVPEYTSIVDLISFVGGPTDDSNLDELRIYRIENNKEVMIPFDFNDLMWEDGLDGKYKKVPTIKPSDILVIPGEPRLYFLDWLSMSLSVISVLSALSVLILTINNTK